MLEGQASQYILVDFWYCRFLAIFLFYCEHFSKICTTDRRQINANKQKDLAWKGQPGCPTRMHLWMRRPRSRLSLGGCFFIQFAFFFVAFSTLPSERCFLVLRAIVNTFGKLFEHGGNNVFCNISKENYDFQDFRASIFIIVIIVRIVFADSILELILLVCW